MTKGSGTRSGLLWEIERLLQECLEIGELPQILLMENVPEVHGQKNRQSFNNWLNFLESIGYKSYWQDLNAKNFGVPQNRNRTFMVSVLGDFYYEFPQPIKLEKRLKDMLETEIDEKYYLSDKIVDYFVRHTEESKEKGNGFKFEPNCPPCEVIIKPPHGYYSGEIRQADVFPTIDTGTSTNWHCVLGEPKNE